MLLLSLLFAKLSSLIYFIFSDESEDSAEEDGLTFYPLSKEVITESRPKPTSSNLKLNKKNDTKPMV